MSETFGNLNDFSVGDVVLWSKLGRKMTGVISELHLVFEGGREVAHADVFCFEKEQKHDVLCLNLKIISKNDLEA
tara:strand:+ start:715 stop:939 length:225 start_codon:yes stop_codon:yes gene_type:complete